MTSFSAQLVLLFSVVACSPLYANETSGKFVDAGGNLRLAPVQSAPVVLPSSNAKPATPAGARESSDSTEVINGTSQEADKGATSITKQPAAPLQAESLSEKIMPADAPMGTGQPKGEATAPRASVPPNNLTQQPAPTY